MKLKMAQTDTVDSSLNHLAITSFSIGQRWLVHAVSVAN